jgi:hypothetical protein
MSNLSHRSVPLHRNPSLRPGLAALVEWLTEGDYTAHAIGRILDHTAVEGTPTGAPCLDPADEYGASSVFCDALDLVPYSADAWSFDDVYLDARMLADGVHPFPFGPEPDSADAPDAPRWSRSAALGELLRTGSVRALPPLGGGSPEAEPFEPSQADWDCYSQWARELEARYAAAEAARTPTAAEVRAWYDTRENNPFA